MVNAAAPSTATNAALSADKACDRSGDVTPQLQPRGHGTFPLKERENLHPQFSTSKTAERWHLAAAIATDSPSVKKGFKKIYGLQQDLRYQTHGWHVTMSCERQLPL